MGTTKITFLGAGSTLFAKNVLGDCMLAPSLAQAEFAPFDIDGLRLKDSATMLETLNRNVNGSRAQVTACDDRRKALAGSSHVVNPDISFFKGRTKTARAWARGFASFQDCRDHVGVRIVAGGSHQRGPIVTISELWVSRGQLHSFNHIDVCPRDDSNI